MARTRSILEKRVLAAVIVGFSIAMLLFSMVKPRIVSLSNIPWRQEPGIGRTPEGYKVYLEWLPPNIQKVKGEVALTGTLEEIKDEYKRVMENMKTRIYMSALDYYSPSILKVGFIAMLLILLLYARGGGGWLKPLAAFTITLLAATYILARINRPELAVVQVGPFEFNGRHVKPSSIVYAQLATIVSHWTGEPQPPDGGEPSDDEKRKVANLTWDVDWTAPGWHEYIGNFTVNGETLDEAAGKLGWAWDYGLGKWVWTGKGQPDYDALKDLVYSYWRAKSLWELTVYGPEQRRQYYESLGMVWNGRAWVFPPNEPTYRVFASFGMGWRVDVGLLVATDSPSPIQLDIVIQAGNDTGRYTQGAYTRTVTVSAGNPAVVDYTAAGLEGDPPSEIVAKAYMHGRGEVVATAILHLDLEDEMAAARQLGRAIASSETAEPVKRHCQDGKCSLNTGSAKTAAALSTLATMPLPADTILKYMSLALLIAGLYFLLGRGD